MENNLKYTYHAEKRLKQRGIPPSVVDFIISYGQCINTYAYSKHFIKKESLKFLKSEYSAFIKKYEKQLKNTAIVCHDDIVVTVMKVTKKIRMDYAY